MVVGTLMWQPFDVKFRELLERMAVHKHNISEELRVWKVRRDLDEHAEAARWREYVRQEHQDAERERHLAQEERRMGDMEREQNDEMRKGMFSFLSQVQDKQNELERERLGKV